MEVFGLNIDIWLMKYVWILGLCLEFNVKENAQVIY